jgi:hypothetical protein
MTDRPRLSPARALLLWIGYVVLFAIAGGLAAGVLALLYEAVESEFADMLYAVVYGVTGYVAVQLARRVFEDR